MVSMLPPVTSASAGGSSGAYGHLSKGSKKSKETGYRQFDSLSLPLDGQNSITWFSGLLAYFKRFFYWLLALITLPLAPFKKRFNSVSQPTIVRRLSFQEIIAKSKRFPEREEESSKALRKSLMAHSESSSVILEVMDNVYYENFRNGLVSHPIFSPENKWMTTHAIPPSLLLKGASEEVVVRTFAAQSSFTKSKILERLPTEVARNLNSRYPHLNLMQDSGKH